MLGTEIRDILLAGSPVTFYPKGNSMTPLINSGDKVTLKPVVLAEVKKGDIVFCKVRQHFYTHLVTAVQLDRVQISNNHGVVNGWTSQVFGIKV